MTKTIQFPSPGKILFTGVAALLMTTGCFAQASTPGKRATIRLGGKPIHTVGKLAAVGTMAKSFTLTGVDLTDKTLADFKGKYLIMNIFPSVNTGVCSKSVRKFNEDAAGLKNTTVLCISKDLPFAQK